MKIFVPQSFQNLLGTALAVVLFLLLNACGKSGVAGGPPLSESNQRVMDGYEKVRAALAEDDLRAAKKASNALAETLKTATTAAAPAPMLASAEELANDNALDRARQTFKTMSAQAIRLTSGAKGFYVINCPMTPNGDWVQTNETVDNPYMGKIMHDCGIVKK